MATTNNKIRPGNLIRPRIDEFYIWRIRKAFPQETAGLLTIEKVIEFALKKALEYGTLLKFERGDTLGK